MIAYHFLSADNAISDISLRRIRISRYNDLNDPFELLSVREDNLDRRALREWKTKFNKDHGLLCFSRDYQTPVLWSHYATKHRGIALGFELGEGFATDVRYTTTRLEVGFTDGDRNKGLGAEFIQDLLLTKYKHWDYEKEVRAHVALDHGSLEGGSYFYPFDMTIRLSEVILGVMCELPIERVRSLVHENYDRVGVCKARMAHKYFSIVRDEASVNAENSYWDSKGQPPFYGPKTEPETA